MLLHTTVAGVLLMGGGIIHTLLYNIDQSVSLRGVKLPSKSFIYNYAER